MTANCGETGVGDEHDLAIWHRFTEPPAQSARTSSLTCRKGCFTGTRASGDK